MTTVLSIHTKEVDPDKAYDALRKAMDLIEDLRSIEGLRVVVSGDIQVTVHPEVPPVAVPEWVHGPTRRRWTKAGINVALSAVRQENA